MPKTADTEKFERTAAFIYALLNQDRQWISKDRVRHDIEQMSVRYKRNVIGFMESRARQFATYYSWGEIESVYGAQAREIIGQIDGEPVFGRLISLAPEPGSMAADALDSAMNAEWEHQHNDPVGWLRGKKLVARLIADVEAGRGGEDD